MDRTIVLKSVQRYLLHIISCLYGLGVSFNLISAPVATSNLSIIGSILIPPPCVINNLKPITLEFGEVFTTRVDGQHYRRQIEYTLECSEANVNTLRMMIRGNDAGFGNGELRTTVNDLGLMLDADGNVLYVNSWIPFNTPQQPKLYATPVKRPGSTLHGQTFSAVATMIVDYR